MSEMRLLELLHFGQTELQGAGVPEHELDARLLLQYCTGKSRSGIFLDGGCPAAPEIIARYHRLLERRKKREPLAYIIGEQEFWSLSFSVSPDVLIPRPETEFLLDRVLVLTDPQNLQKGRVLDLCCGSGVIATVLARETGRKVIASDISYQALQVTMHNSRLHHLESLLVPVQGDLLRPFCSAEPFSLIVANPPYVSSFDVANTLAPEVAGFEPHLALDGGERGLELIQRIRRALPAVLCPGGQCFMEIGADQGTEIQQLFSENNGDHRDFDKVEIFIDYAGRDRVVHLRRAQ